MDKSLKECFHPFKGDLSNYSVPENFNFPFCYEPEDLGKLAASELQEWMEEEGSFRKAFHLDDLSSSHESGKMFGVLVVQNQEGELGYLKAFSGDLFGSSTFEGFVPSVYDRYSREGFFEEEENNISKINEEINAFEKSHSLEGMKKVLLEEGERGKMTLAQLKQSHKKAKEERKGKREKAKEELNPSELESLFKELTRESVEQRLKYKALSQEFRKKIQGLEEDIELYFQKLRDLKEERKRRSLLLQDKLFKEYSFLNIQGEEMDLLDLFRKTPIGRPPSGAGDCAAPRLLQYAFKHGLVPITMAEFWWGPPPKQEVRKHKNFYPACRGKCRPILTHMLKGMKLDPDPLAHGVSKGEDIQILFEDDSIIVLHKPQGLLAVPGIEVYDSVASRIQERYPDLTGPLIVHRLDMATSGIMLIGKNKEVHKQLQTQFIKRSIQKRYVALLDGILEEDEGIVDLPLRPDFLNRPRQIVCHDQGKSARTKWEVIERKEGKTKVYFYPVTGRTHQLRVHSAHPEGLDTPIVGDRLYGKPDKRLCLHAESITLYHPKSNERLTFTDPVEF